MSEPFKMPLPPFAPGSPIALRSITSHADGSRAVGFTVAGLVVVDTGDLSVVCTPVGSDLRRRAGRGSGPNGRLVLAADWDGAYRSGQWMGATVVRVHERGTPWSVWRWHDGTVWLPDWYVNLEAPWQRSPIGFDTEDWALDVTAHDSPSGWVVRYKDEDELEYLVDVGQVTPDHVTRVRHAGARAFDAATARTWPFDADWSPWLAEDLTPVTLPATWSTLTR